MATKPVGAAEAIAQAISNMKARPRGCGVVKFYDTLTPADRAVFIEAAGHPISEVPHTALVAASAAMGHRVRADMWGRHRRGQCGCMR